MLSRIESDFYIKFEYSKLFPEYICECVECESLTGLVGYHEHHCNCTDFYNLIMSDIGHYFYLRKHWNICTNGKKLVSEFCSDKAITIGVILFYSIIKTSKKHIFFGFAYRGFFFTI